MKGMTESWLKQARAEGRITNELAVKLPPPVKSLDFHVGLASAPPPTSQVGLLFVLPYPPTLNTYWRHVGAKVLISEKGRAYRKTVRAAAELVMFNRTMFTGPLKVQGLFLPPDQRRRDLDNLPKAILDALCHAGVYKDDSQIRHLDIQFGTVAEGGSALIWVRDMPEPARMEL